jgi:hypothetical protein
MIRDGCGTNYKVLIGWLGLSRKPSVESASLAAKVMMLPVALNFPTARGKFFGMVVCRRAVARVMEGGSSHLLQGQRCI